MLEISVWERERDGMQSFVLPYEPEVVIAVGIIAIISFLFGVIAFAGGTRQKRKLRKWKSIHATADLEEVYARTLEEVGRLHSELKGLEEKMVRVREEVKMKISTARIQRYNAFSETGSDLSFSIALLDDNSNGVVLSSIYGRDESRTYAKPVHDGRSEYALTEEELHVISKGEGNYTSNGKKR